MFSNSSYISASYSMFIQALFFCVSAMGIPYLRLSEHSQKEKRRLKYPKREDINIYIYIKPLPYQPTIPQSISISWSRIFILNNSIFSIFMCCAVLCGVLRLHVRTSRADDEWKGGPYTPNSCRSRSSPTCRHTTTQEKKTTTTPSSQSVVNSVIQHRTSPD